MLETIGTIVVPVDFSDASQLALRTALNVARRMHSTLHVLHVYQDAFSILSVRTLDLTPEAVERIMLKEIHERFDALIDGLGADVPIVTVARKGDTAESILEYSNEIAADLIVIATNARTGLEHIFIGSITQRIVRTASCPVLTCRATAQS